MPLAGLGGCLETYFWQTPHSMIPLASWMAVWCTNTGYSVSQGCSRSCFLCLWAAGDRGMCARRGYHTSQKASGSPATRVTPFSLLQVVRDTADQHSAKLQQRVEALLCCCGVLKPCRCCVALPRAPEIYLPCIRGHCAALGSQNINTLYLLQPSREGGGEGRKGPRNHIKHTEMGVQSGHWFCKVTKGVRRRVTGLHAGTQTLPSQTMRLRGEAGFRRNSSWGLRKQSRKLHFLFMLLATPAPGLRAQRLEAS